MNTFFRQSSLTALFCLLLGSLLSAQKPVKPSAADVHDAIKKLNVLGSVLYVAAHPDDENQRFISYCASEKHYNVTYLSLTRGDGGQNLIGPEIRELLGVLRTEELLMARSIDGGKQRFSRANDFGFSKNPEETLRFWDKTQVLSDVVWAIRETRPDVIVNRFFHDKKYDTHGHHTASAMLSVEAYDLAGKADAYPEQLKYTEVWQPRRQFFNTSWWFYGGQEAFNKMDKSNLISVDLGVYYPLKGKSNNEVASEARSMHRCQGFGNLTNRGESVEYFDFIKGERPGGNDLFEGINTTWSRVKGGEPIGALMAKIDREFRSDNPSASVPDLLKALQLIQALPDGYWRNIKLAETKEVIRGCIGLYLEATASDPTATPGQTVNLRLEAINRSRLDVQLVSYNVLPALKDSTTKTVLANNVDWTLNTSVKIPDNAPYTAPYWLQKESTIGMYNVEDLTLRGQPETPRFVKVRWSVTVAGMLLDYESVVAFKAGESAVGEVWRPFEILPPVFVECTEASYLFSDKDKNVSVRVKAGSDNVSGIAGIQAPAGWTVSNVGDNTFNFKKKGEEKTFLFKVNAASGAADGQLAPFARIGDKQYAMRLITIKYDHIPQQSVLQPAKVHASRADVRVSARNIGYYMGAGDDIPAALRQIGCTVTLLEDKDLDAEKLAKFDAVVLGVRAYDTKDQLIFHQPALFEYVQKGGTLVTQYNNSFSSDGTSLAPYPLKLSRQRVTDETADIRMLLPEHPVLNGPNKLTAADFSGWVQERGLYYPSEWDANFSAPLSMNDPDEKALDGALLVAPYGQGQFVYTGISFFRQLPAGVPGAYRLFANLISLGKAGVKP
ncbi:MAG TPA: PIG-L family deacetylase [Saprospiraceae bacterium]|nr:PIG-L family deacetylase [Saprospiraceae bacterium]